ncbi:MAG: tetratricopeptide repeat protein [Nitrospirota bacterium]
MTKIAVLLVIVFLASLGYLAILNSETVTIKISEQYNPSMPKIALVILSCAIGALSTLAVVAVRDTRRYIEHLQNQRKHKKDLKVQELYSKGLDAFFACRHEEAAELFNHILEEDPDNVDSLLRRGDIAFNTGNPVKAKEFYTKAKELRPQSVEALFSLEKVFEAEQRWLEALRYLDNILEIDEGNPKALYRKREIYETNRNWEALLAVQYKILKIDIPQADKQKEHKNLQGYRYELGRYNLEKGDTDKAKKILRVIIKMDKDFVAAYLALAEAYLKDGDVEEAENLLIKGYEVTSALVFLARLEDFFIAVGEPGRIIDLYQKTILKNPKDQKLQFFLAKLYYRLEMIDYAFETIMGIDATTTDYRDLHILLGNIYERRSQYDKAGVEFKKALKAEMPLLIPFCCSDCNYTSNEWTGRCPTCQHWNTLKLDLSGTCKI